MPKSWNYSDLSHAAHEGGGPEKYIDSIFQNGVSIGKTKMYPYVGLAGLIGSLVSSIAFIAISRKKEKTTALALAEVKNAQEALLTREDEPDDHDNGTVE